MAPSALSGAVRRSTRLSAKAQVAAKRPDEDDAGADASDAESLERPAKRRRITTSNTSADRKQRAGKKNVGSKRSLSKLLDMPLDVLFEIFGHLDPLDVLHLARSNKAIRNVLMRRSSITIWKEARSHIEGLPDCPADLSEPQYADLVFDPHCHFCLTARVLNVLWRNRVRCCKQCLKANFMDMAAMYRCFYGFVSEYKMPQPWAMISCDPYRNKHYYLNSRVMELQERYEEIVPDLEKFKEFEQERVKAVKKLEKDADILSSWHTEQSYLRSQELDDLRYKRRQGIIMKLIQMNLGAEIEVMDDDMIEVFLNHPAVKQPKELTDRIWNNIKGPILEIVYHAQAIRIAKTRCIRVIPHIPFLDTRYADFAKSRPHTEYLPRIADFCMMPEIRAILGDATVVIQTARKLDDLRPRFPELSERWRQECSRQLLPLLPDAAKQNQVNDEDMSPLQLATTFFKCSSCFDTVGYPRILAHECMRYCTMNGDGGLDLSHTIHADLKNTVQLVYDEQPWHLSAGSIEYNQGACDTVAAVVRACGEDPATITASEMDEMDHRFVCANRKCLRNGVVHVVTWRTAEQHDKIYHPVDHTGWQLLDPGDTADMKLNELMDDERYMVEIWSCTHCRSNAVRLNVVKAHLNDK
ncbi:hypothetical protein BKA93DRAFT_779142 [Sparassis latifolia]